MEKIEFAGVKGDLECFGPELLDAVGEVMESGEFILGSHVAEFEDAVCNYLGCKHAIGMSSGSDALISALHCAGIERGDAVITTPYTFISTVSAILMLGAVPVYIDIHPYTYNIEADKIRMVLEMNDNVRAILPVHLFGHPCNMNAIMGIAREYDIDVIEDACQAFGADVPFPKKRSEGGTTWRKAGTIGDVGCFSFFPSKVLGAIGDAGMCVTDNDDIAHDLRAMRNHGQYLYKYQHDALGWNMRMDGIQAAVLRTKLSSIDRLIRARRNVAIIYGADLSDLDLGGHVVTPLVDHQQGFFPHVYAQYALRVMNGHRDPLAEHLRKAGVPVGIHYPRIIPEQPMFDPRDQSYRYDTQEAELLANENLCLPMHPWVTPDQIEYICKSIHEYYEEQGLTRDREAVDET